MFGQFIRGEGLVVAVCGIGAAVAEELIFADDLAVVVDAFSTEGAGDALGFVAGHLAGVKRYADPLFAEEIGEGEFAVGEHLLLVLVFDVGVELAGAGFGGLKRGDADGFVDGGFADGLQGRGEVNEGGGHLAPVAELEGAFAEATAGDDSDGVGGTSIDLNEGDEALAVFWGETTAWVFDAQTLAAEHGHADTKDLTGAEMAMGYFGFFE